MSANTNTNIEQRIKETKDMLYFTYDEEPVEFHGYDTKVHVTKIRPNDRFRHRGKGWVTATDVDVKRTRVKIEFVDEHGNHGKAFPTMDLQEDVPIVRQEETDEHKLWRLEHELTWEIAGAAKKAKATLRRETEAFIESIKTHGPSSGIQRHGSDAVAAETSNRFWTTLAGLMDREPKRRYGYHREESWTKGDAATTLLWHVDDHHTSLLDEVAARSSSSDSLWEATRLVQMRTDAGLCSERRYYGVGLVAAKAQTIVKLREQLAKDVKEEDDETTD